MKLSQWAKEQGISYMTAFRWFHKGQIPNAIQYPNGTILVQEQTQTKTTNKQVSIYCRVSSYEKKDDLERQVQRCTDFCIANGYVIKEIVKEIASGMNDKRLMLNTLQEGQSYYSEKTPKDKRYDKINIHPKLNR